MSGIDLLAQLRADAQGLRFVADHNRKKGETVYAVRQLDHLAASLTAAADKLAAIDALHQPQTKPTLTNRCDECGTWWPCPTKLLIHPEDGAS